jgi:hypothetical protein
MSPLFGRSIAKAVSTSPVLPRGLCTAIRGHAMSERYQFLHDSAASLAGTMCILALLDSEYLVLVFGRQAPAACRHSSCKPNFGAAADH